MDSVEIIFHPYLSLQLIRVQIPPEAFGGKKKMKQELESEIECDGACVEIGSGHSGEVKAVKLHVTYRDEPVTVNYCRTARVHDRQVPSVTGMEILDDD